MRLRLPLFVSTLAFVTAFAMTAAAQESGGSYGGSHFGGSSSSSSSGSSYSSSSSSSSSGDNYSSANGPRDPMDIVVAIGVLLLFGSAFYFLRKLYLRPVVDPNAPPLDLSALSLGIDWRARAAVQQRLKELSGQATGSVADLTKLLHETVALLKASRVSWLYGATVSQ